MSDLEREKRNALKTIKDRIEDAITNDTFKTHELLYIVIHECLKLIKSDF